MRGQELVAGRGVLGRRVGEGEVRVANGRRRRGRSRLFVLRRVRLADGEPISVQTAHIPAAFVPGIRIEEGASLYEVLQSRYHLYAARARETYSAATAAAPAADLLGIPAGSPVFAVERVTLLPNEKPFEFVRSIIRADKYSIVLDLVKGGAEHRQLALRNPARVTS